MTSLSEATPETTAIEVTAAEYDIWREDDESDAALARRTIASLREWIAELEASIHRLTALASSVE